MGRLQAARPAQATRIAMGGIEQLAQAGGAQPRRDAEGDEVLHDRRERHQVAHRVERQVIRLQMPGGPHRGRVEQKGMVVMRREESLDRSGAVAVDAIVDRHRLPPAPTERGGERARHRIAARAIGGPRHQPDGTARPDRLDT